MQLELQFIYRRKIPWSGLIVLCLMVVMALFSTTRWLTLQSKIVDIQERRDELAVKFKKQQRAILQNQMKTSPSDALRIAEQQKIIKSLQYPWSRVFAPMEQSDEKGVAILSFTHQQADGISQLKVEALDTPTIIRFVDKMNEGDAVDRWYIASYQIQNQSIPSTVKANILNQ